MKYLRLLPICIILTGVLTSCQSLNESNEPPIVDLRSNKTNIGLGDTLQIFIHVSDPELRSGSIDFKNGRIVTFKNLSSVLDTMITHVYFAAGAYDIQGSFTDGDLTTRKAVSIFVGQPPIVDVQCNTTDIGLGDTLRIFIRVIDTDLRSGSIDFRDGSIVLLDHLRPVFDTTLTHVYSALGTYELQVSFRNAEYSSHTAVSILVRPATREFTCPISVGMTWRFKYEQRNLDNSMGRNYWRWGLHEWSIHSMSVSNQDTLYQATVTRNDSVHSITWNPLVGGYYKDTSYAASDVRSFTITVSSTAILFDWPSVYIPTVMKRMPRQVPFHTLDTVWVVEVYYPGNWSNQYSIFKENVGLLYSTLDDGGNHTWRERLTLIDFIKP